MSTRALMGRGPVPLVVLAMVGLCGAAAVGQGTRGGGVPALQPLGTSKGQQYSRLVVRNGMVVNGRGTPAEGPMDIVVERDRIVDMIPVDPVSLRGYGPAFTRPDGDRVIDATGMYVLPGLIDMHGHVPGDHEERVGAQGMAYAFRLWLGQGVTTLRDPGTGAGLKLMVEQRRLSEANEIVAPRLRLYMRWPGTSRRGAAGHTPEEARALVRQFREQGADGIKVSKGPGHFPDVIAAICDEAKKLGMGVAVDLKVSETDAVIASNAGVTSIEHWYGVPDAAIPGSQSFPSSYNYWDELDRFRYAGKLWAEADRDPAKILEVLDLMIRNGTAWDPTMVVYEANRDLTRVLNLPWREGYALPSLIEHWAPNPAHHASFHSEWTTTDETWWKENYHIWMKYIREFFNRGGRLTVGSDAGTQQALWGFSSIRELELLQEAGIHPIDIIKIATTDSAEVLGLKDQSGLRIANIADIIVVDGNPLENFKVLYGMGYDRYLPDGRQERRGGVHWTIKAGVVFDARALLREVEWYVRQAKSPSATSQPRQ